VHWLPFLPEIAEREGVTIDSILDRILSHEIQLILAWDDQDKRAAAVAGVSYFLQGEKKVADLVWLIGSKRDEWQHLLSELEEYWRHIGCVNCKSRCRIGWSRLFKQHGYKIRQIVVEKSL